MVIRAAAMLLLLSLLACGDRTAIDQASQLPPASTAMHDRLAASLTAARSFEKHVWRDVQPLNGDDTLNGYVEITRGESTKWEFRIPLNRREVDRLIPTELGGYPINYGFVPRTISYDGDPTDVLVLGPPIAGGELVKGRIVALMRMIDTGDIDSKIVMAPVDERGGARETLTAADRERMERFFNVYKRHEGKVTRITGWGSEADARHYLRTTAGFFDAGATGR